MNFFERVESFVSCDGGKKEFLLLILLLIWGKEDVKLELELTSKDVMLIACILGCIRALGMHLKIRATFSLG